MSRFIVGRFSRTTIAPVPREGREILISSALRVWAVGHSKKETCAVSMPSADGSDTQVLTAGCCLATDRERLAAVRAAHAGDVRAVCRLPGAHLTVVREGWRTWIVGDRAGVVPVYWVPDRNGIWWATHAAPLAALNGSSPNLALLLGELALNGVDTRHTDGPYNGVRRVPPGHALVVGDGSYEAKVLDMHPAQSVDFLDGADAVRDAFTTAVTRRVKSWDRLSSDLSGGIDSSSVTSVAACTRPLLAVTYTDAQMRKGDDLQYARHLAEAVDGINHVVIDGTVADVRHFDGLEEVDQLPVTDTPSLTLGLLAIKDAQLAPATAYGAQAHLTGRGGDNVLDAVTAHLVDQFLSGQRLPALRCATAYAHSRCDAPWRAWQQVHHTASTAYPDALERLAAGITASTAHPRSPIGALAWCSVTPGASWLTAAGQSLVTELIRARAGTADPDVTPARLHERLALEWMATSHAQYAEIGLQRWQLAIHAPLLDTTVVDACLSIPTYQRARPGTYKPLAQAAFAGLAPAWLFTRSSKTAFTGSLYAGLSRNAPTLRRILGSSQLVEAGLLNYDSVATALDSAISGVAAPLAQLHTLVVTELWIRRTSTAYATWWSEEALACR
ncbi:asparagine synthase-related protein [Streptomyces sp. RS10V-4]|uniref:asparagine synthase-related protein n=1 Tax=Streptomyces rhizoryzae TaxID=2932493 RepID=UPI0020029B77|nr:asparagine synthase-related protein [Streptomyces rhizoryzae]MCK7627226.1 asparagine synthase-related protein [Streptomyces rhizoryzae]